MITHNQPTGFGPPVVHQTNRFWFTFAVLLPSLQLLIVPTVELLASETAGIARAIADGAGEIVRQTPPAKTGPVYVFEENHLSSRAQVQIATMLTRLHKRYGLQIIGLQGSVQAHKPLLAKTFVPGRDPAARQDALRRMLANGEISGAKYVGALNPGIEIAGLERREEYDISISPSGGVSPSFTAIIAISETLLSKAKLNEFVQLVQAKKIDAAIELLKDGHPWLREQFESKSDDNLQDQLRRQQTILKKANDLKVDLPKKVKKGMQQTLRFYQVADLRSETMTANMAILARRQAGAPTAMIIDAVHTDHVMKSLGTAGVQAVLLRPQNLLQSTNSSGFNDFENKVKVLCANHSEGSFGSILNKALSDAKPNRDWEPLLGIGDLSQQSIGSLEYVTSAVAQAARTGLCIPIDLPDDLGNLLGGVSIDPKSFSQDDYDVIFCVFVEQPGKTRQRMWVRTGTVIVKPEPGMEASNSDSKEADMTKLVAADNEPPRKQPVDPAAQKNSGNGEPREIDSSPKGTGAEPRGIASILLADAQTRYKAFTSREEARSCPRISSP